jgi:hypothetical protein
MKGAQAMSILRYRSEPKAATRDIETAPACPPEPERPPLILLANDAASLTARRIHSFPGSTSAGRFVEFWFPPEHRAGLVAFWALQEPAAGQDYEAVVLIRHESNRGLAYPLSFTSMERALATVRREMARGLHIGRVAIFYAVPVCFGQASGGAVTVTPDEPPVPQSVTEPPSVPEATPAILQDSLFERAFRAIRLRAWGTHPAPFAGFGSPPGRF